MVRPLVLFAFLFQYFSSALDTSPSGRMEVMACDQGCKLNAVRAYDKAFLSRKPDDVAAVPLTEDCRRSEFANGLIIPDGSNAAYIRSSLLSGLSPRLVIYGERARSYAFPMNGTVFYDFNLDFGLGPNQTWFTIPVHMIFAFRGPLISEISIHADPFAFH